MRIKTLLVFESACVLVALAIAVRYIAENGAKPQPMVESTTALVARHSLSLGTLISEPESLFAEQVVTKQAGPRRAIHRYSDLKGRRLNKLLAEGQTVAVEDLIETDA